MIINFNIISFDIIQYISISIDILAMSLQEYRYIDSRYTDIYNIIGIPQLRLDSFNNLRDDF